VGFATGARSPRQIECAIENLGRTLLHG
jgi:hypothetical protein